MKASMQDVFDAWPVLMKINRLPGLPANIAYRIRKQLQKLEPEMKTTNKEIEPLMKREIECLDPVEWPMDNMNLSPAELAMVEKFITVQEFEAMIQPITLTGSKK